MALPLAESRSKIAGIVLLYLVVQLYRLWIHELHGGLLRVKFGVVFGMTDPSACVRNVTNSG